MRNRKNNILIIVALWLALILMSGCEDTHITTDIEADGSCRRTVVVKGDSKGIFDTAYPVPKDESWEISTEWKQEKTRKRFIYTAAKSFAAVEDLANEIADQHPLDSYVQVSLTRDWRGFFTHYTYREAYRDIFPFKKYPLSKSFSADEIVLIGKQLTEEEDIEKILTKEKEKELEKRFKHWFLRATFEEYYDILKGAIKKMDGSEVSLEELELGKEEIFEKAFKEKDMLEEVGLETALEATASIYGEAFVQEIAERFKKDFDNYQRKFRIIDGLIGDSFTNNVRMPGIITSANTDILEGNVATWKFGPSHFLFQEYEMLVESRKLNGWAVAGAGSIVIVLILILLFTTVRRRS
jgi:hypothetical protein